ncbi:unnamed protein product [Urochloa decumbens]|uniref:Uncharacterized protein n=1 Tax=Urochloa decumbens TaxID=240449 RepID=A0ABC9BM76_9POAL
MASRTSNGVIDSVLAKLNELMMGDMCSNFIGISSMGIQFLWKELSTMNALLEKLEDDIDELDAQANNWRNQVKEMTYDIEDCIDEFMSSEGISDNVKVGFINKISHFLTTLKSRVKTAWQIKDLKTRLQEIDERHKRYTIAGRSSSTTATIDPRLSALYKDAAKLIGIENPKEELIGKMDKGQQFKVVSIVGFGGLGKTTLANEVYREVKGQFNSKAFVSISQNPDMARILQRMWLQLEPHTSHVFEVQDLINNIRKHLEDKSYPEDHKINKVELARRFVAEGFVSSSGQDVWNVAESYVIELANRSMIQPVYEDDDITVSYYTVHDMLLELIIRKCREENFISLVQDQQVMAEEQDKVIRRLTVNLSGGVDNGTMAMRTTWHLAQVRSLGLLGGSNWIPFLHQFKFLRVLFLDICRREVKMDLTQICKLALLRYLKVKNERSLGEISIVLPVQIIRMRYLETLELPALSACCLPSDIVQLPRLSHLVVPHDTGLPDGIEKLKSLRSLEGFNMLMSSIENINGLGELENLSDLSIHCHTRSLEYVIALGRSIRKLSNLQKLSVSCTLVGSCDDALAFCLTSLHNLRHLDLLGCNFDRIPYIGSKAKFRRLRLGAKQILQEDIGMMGNINFLVQLHLRVTRTLPEKLVISGSTGLFVSLKVFELECEGISHLTFEVGAMPALRKLWLAFDPTSWNKATPAGIQHLSSLQELYILIVRNNSTSGSEAPTTSLTDTAVIHRAFQEAADAHPGRPMFTLGEGWLIRAMESCRTL